jgi:hypothetical protein
MRGHSEARRRRSRQEKQELEGGEAVEETERETM